MILPAHPVFDPWRWADAVLRDATEAAMGVAARLAGSIEEIEGRQVWAPGTIIRGTLGADGVPQSSFYFPKPLSDIYEPWDGVNHDKTQSIYAWKDGFLGAAEGGWAIIMDMAFECPDTVYPGHWKERGFNPIYSVLSGSQLILIGCRFINCDTGFLVGGTKSVVYKPVVTTKGTKRTGISGHYGGRLSGANNVLLSDETTLNFLQDSHHSVSVQGARNCAHIGLNGKSYEIDFHAYSGDEQDDGNLVALCKNVRAITIGGATKNRPWDGDGTLFYKVTKPDGTPVSIPTELHATLITDNPGGEPMPLPTLAVGDTVEALSELVIRSGPAKATPSLGTQPKEAQGRVIAAPVFDAASGFTYVGVDFVMGIDGYCGADKLTKLASAPPPVDPKVTARQKLQSPIWQPLTATEAALVVP